MSEAIRHSVGIIIPNYNYGRYLEELVDSILALRVPPVFGGTLGKVTLVDDCSTDDSADQWAGQMRRLSEAGIPSSFIRRERNGGTAATLNTAASATKTDWLLPIGADDRVQPHALEELAARAYERGKRVADMVAFGYTAFGVNSKGVAINPKAKRSTRLYEHHPDIVQAFRAGQRLSTGCSPFWREWWIRYGFNEALRTAEDTDFWVRCGTGGARMIPSTRPCMWVRYHPKRKSFSKIRTRKERRRDIEQSIKAMPPVDFYATETHFLTHLAPMWHALPAPYRGAVHVPPSLSAQAEQLGLRHNVVGKHSRSTLGLRTSKGLVVVASSGDHHRARQAGRFTIFCEHGAGQSYTRAVRHSSYAGYPNRSGVAGFLVPGPHPAELNRRAYPNHPVYEVGCPKLDAWTNGSVTLPDNEKPVVCISFHWNCKICPETRTALGHYQDHLKALRESLERHGVVLIGHGHPRIQSQVQKLYAQAGIEFVRTFEEVLRRADCYVIDNSSTGFEFAATTRPVVWLNCPGYRKHIKHGLRFWTAADTGLQCNHPTDLRETILEALAEPAERRAERRERLSTVYSVLDGSASERAARAIVEIAQQFKRRGVPGRKARRTKHRDTIVPLHQREIDMANPDQFIFLQAGNSSFKNAQLVALVELPTGEWQRPANGRVARRQRFAILDNKRGRSWQKIMKQRRLVFDTKVTFPSEDTALPEPASSPAVEAVNKAPTPKDKETAVGPSGEVVAERVVTGGGVEDEDDDPTDGEDGGDVFAEERRGSYYYFSDGERFNGKPRSVEHLVATNGWSKQQAEAHIESL